MIVTSNDSGTHTHTHKYSTLTHPHKHTHLHATHTHTRPRECNCHRITATGGDEDEKRNPVREVHTRGRFRPQCTRRLYGSNNNNNWTSSTRSWIMIYVYGGRVLARARAIIGVRVFLLFNNYSRYAVRAPNRTAPEDAAGYKYARDLRARRTAVVVRPARGTKNETILDRRPSSVHDPFAPRQDAPVRHDNVSDFRQKVQAGLQRELRRVHESSG